MIVVRSVLAVLVGASLASMSGSVIADATTDARGPVVPDSSLPNALLPPAVNAVLPNQSFEGAFPPAGWIVRNQSTTIGSNTNCWNQATANNPYPGNTGTNQAIANFNCTTGSNTISGWLITEPVANIKNGDTVTFWTRVTASPQSYPDRLELRMCTDTTPDSCGAAGSSGTLSTDVGQFTALLTSVNPALNTTAYPGTYTQFTGTVTGVPTPVGGRFAFRYFVTAGGPAGANSDRITLDDVEVVAAPLNADLSITKTDSAATVAVGSSTIYTVTASNAGPDAVTDATVADTAPASCGTFTWTCVGAGGGTCAANGSGSINDATVDLPVGGTATYSVTCGNIGAASPLVNTATIAAPAGATDGTPGNNSATDSNTVTSNVPPVFAYAPTPTSAVNFTGGGAVGSIGNGSIAVSIQTAGVGTGAASTTTTTCTAPTAPFAGFGQSVTAEGAGAISGSPLTGTCTLGVAPAIQTLTCSENQGGTPVVRTFELTCPAGTLTPLTSTPASGGTVTLPSQLPGGATTTALIDFQNGNAAPVDVTCTAPAAPFSASPLLFTVPANGSASVTVSFDSTTVGSFTGTLDCTAGNQNFSFNLAGSALSPDVPVPAIGDAMRNLLVLLTLVIGGVAFGFRRRA